MVKKRVLRKEIHDIKNKKVEDRTEKEHLKLVKAFGGVRNYLLSMGAFKEECNHKWICGVNQPDCIGECIYMKCSKCEENKDSYEATLKQSEAKVGGQDVQ